MSARWGMVALLAWGAVSLGSSQARAQCAATCAGVAPGCNVVTCTGGPCFGSPGSDCIIGSAVADNIFALGGNDCICGEAGNDIIDGGAGTDFVFGGDDDDTMSGGADPDFMFGDSGNDTINGGGGADQIFGGDGNDTLNGGDDSDQLFGEAGADTLRGEAGNDTLDGGADNDQLFGGDGADSLSGGSGNDSVNGEGDDDPQLDGGDGEDTINGGPGDDTANGGPGLDFISGGDGNDTLNGGDGPDIINGDGGDDTINGDADNDTLDGGAGTNNQLFGNSGQDVCLNAANMDPSCESFTHATLRSFAAFDDGSSIVLRWVTSSEAGTVGYHLYREVNGEWEALHDGVLPALLSAPQGGVYDLRDRSAPYEEASRYLLVEVDLQGNHAAHGPFEITPGSRSESILPEGAVYAREPHRTTALEFATKAAVTEKQSGGAPVAIYLGVEETGLYAVSAAEIAARFGVDEQSVRDRIASGGIDITEEGQTIAWRGAPDGSKLTFFGVVRKSLFTTERIYRLSLGEGVTMAERSAAPEALTDDLTYIAALHLERDQVPGVLVASDPDEDYWFWQLVSAAPALPSTAEVNFDLEAIAGGGTVTVDLHGITDVEHTVDIRLNGTLLGEVSFEGTAPHRETLAVPAAALTEGENTLAIAPTGVSNSQLYLNFVDLLYERQYATSAASLGFRATEDASLEVAGLTGGAVEVLDVSDPRRPVRLTNTVAAASGLRLSTETGSDYFALLLSETRAPSSIWNDTPSDLRAEGNLADYVVIAPATLLAGAQELADYREADGFATQVVELQDIYDEFSYGTPDPNAIRAFLGHANETWSTAPELVVLVGKGSFDYRDLQGMGGNLLPPIMAHTYGGLLSSDTKFADFIDDDGVPDLAIGRLPVVSALELASVITQIAEYEAGLSAIGEDVAMLADATTAEGNFGAWADQATAGLPVEWSVSPIYRSELGDLDSTRALLFDEIRKGPRVFGYLGHAGITSLGKSETLFSIDDVETMTIDGAQPIFAGMTCVASRFAVPGLVSLGETMLLSEEGSIATWGPSGLSVNEQASPLLEGLLAQLSGDTESRLGPMINGAFSAISDSEHAREMMAIYHLFGDPALRVTKGGDVPGTGGTGGSAGSGGTGGTGGVTGTGGTTAPEPSLIMAGCSAGRARPQPSDALLLVLGALALAWRRRRRV